MSWYAAAAQAASGLFGSIASIYNTHEANDTNLYLNRMQRMQQERFFNQSRKWQLDDRLHDELYNHPVNALGRELAAYRAYGLNPALMMSQGTSGMVGSTPTSSLAPPTASSPSQIPAQAADISSGIYQMGSSLLNAEQLQIQRDLADNEIETGKVERVRIQRESSKLLADTENVRAGTAKIRSDAARNVILNACDVINTLAEYNLKNSQRKLTDKQVDTFDEQFKWQMNQLKASIRNLNANSKYLRKQAALLEVQYQVLKKQDAREAVRFAAEFGTTKQQIYQSIQNRLQYLETSLQSAYTNKKIYGSTIYQALSVPFRFVGQALGAIDPLLPSYSYSGKVK